MMKKLKDLNSSILWDEKISALRQYQPENDKFWNFVVHIDSDIRDSIFKDLEEYYNFLSTFWYNLNPKSLSSIQVSRLYSKLWRFMCNDEDLVFFFAHIKPVIFDYFQIMMEKHKFLFTDVDKLSKDEYLYFDKFWTALFMQENLEVSFLKKYYYYFFNNRKYFYFKVITHKAFFQLDQAMINKFKKY